MDNAPIFVKIDEYKEIMKVVDVVNGKLDQIKTSLGNLKEIKKQEDSQIKEWNDKLSTVSDKMKYINDTLKEM